MLYAINQFLEFLTITSVPYSRIYFAVRGIYLKAPNCVVSGCLVIIIVSIVYYSLNTCTLTLGTILKFIILAVRKPILVTVRIFLNLT